jgi:hypothetical protein
MDDRPVRAAGGRNNAMSETIGNPRIGGQISYAVELEV